MSRAARATLDWASGASEWSVAAMISLMGCPCCYRIHCGEECKGCLAKIPYARL